MFRSRSARREISLANKQRGAGMVFIAAFIPVMMLLVLLIADTGQLVFEKIKLQQTVDEAALSAANIQAIGLNEIADLNRAAYEEYITASRILSMGLPWFSSSEGNRAYRYFKRIQDDINDYREDVNRRFAALAHLYADDVVRQNLPRASSQGLVSLSRVQGASNRKLMEYDVERLRVSYGYYTSYCKYCFAMWRHWGGAGPTNRVGFRDGYYMSGGTRTGYGQTTKQLRTRWYKQTPPVTYAAYGLTQRQKRYAVGKTILGKIYPELKVYASAKPTQGDVRYARPYKPIMKHLQRHSPNPSISNLGRIEH